MILDSAVSLSNKVGVKPACQSLNYPRSSYYRHISSKPAIQTILHKRHHLRINNNKRLEILKLLNSERFMDKAPATIHANLLDDGIYICSERTMYRILAENQQVKERRKGHRKNNFAKPELLAERVNQVWSWDITKLKTNKKWRYFHLYVIMDIFSRYVVGWMIAERESEVLAQKLIKQTCFNQQIEPNQLYLHADRGASMKSKAVAQLLIDLKVEKSHSRPHTSNDNPYSEAQFKTLKYHVDFPDRFNNMTEAKLFCQKFFEWYNHEHKHAGIAMLSPYDVHYHKADVILKKRQAVLDEAFARHPERFSKKRPECRKLPRNVWINKPDLET